MPNTVEVIIDADLLAEDVEIFLMNFNTVANAQQWTDAVKLAHRHKFLSGSALDWWNRHQSAISATWASLDTELITQSRAPGYSKLKQEELKGRKMERNKSLLEYYSSVLLLYNILRDLGKTYTAR
jgi:hypothetical protein